MARHPRLLAAAALAMLAGACQTVATVDQPEGAVLALRGPIRARTVDQLTRLVPTTPPDGRLVIALASGGGDFMSALEIAHRLEAIPHSTAVVTRECDSACVVIFAAARERLVARDAVFAVHRPVCTTAGLLGLPCRVFWEPWARREFHARIARVAPRWADYLDAQDPPAFARSGAAAVRVTGSQLIRFDAAAPLTRDAMHLALDGWAGSP